MTIWRGRKFQTLTEWLFQLKFTLYSSLKIKKTKSPNNTSIELQAGILL